MGHGGFIDKFSWMFILVNIFRALTPFKFSKVFVLVNSRVLGHKNHIKFLNFHDYRI